MSVESKLSSSQSKHIAEFRTCSWKASFCPVRAATAQIFFWHRNGSILVSVIYLFIYLFIYFSIPDWYIHALCWIYEDGLKVLDAALYSLAGNRLLTEAKASITAISTLAQVQGSSLKMCLSSYSKWHSE